MTPSEHTDSGKLRLNPFIFPSDTDFRFVLLTIAIISTSLFVFNWLFTTVNGAYVADTILRCNEPIFTTPSPSASPQAQMDQRAEAARIASECVEPLEQQQALWMLVGLASLLAVAFVLYWLMPSILIRRERLQPLTKEDGPEMLAYVEHQCEVMGLAERPAVYWNPHDLSISGQAFGRVGRRCLALTGGLLVQFHTDPSAAQAIVLHELSHFKNQDVDKTYLATAAWYAFVIVALVPFGITLIDYAQRSAFEILFGFGWRLGALALFVFLMRNAILRAREPYADVRAFTYAGTTDGLQRVLASAPREKMNVVTALLSTHPPTTFRQAVLHNTYPLFSLGSGDALAAGVAASIASVSTIYRITEILPPHLEWLANWLYWLVFAPFAVGILALGLWRTAFAQVASGIVGPKPVGRIGIAFGVGLIAGLVLEPQTAVVGVGSFTAWDVDPVFAIFQLVWCAVVIFSCWLFVHWIRRSARVWLAARDWTLHQTRAIVSIGVVLAVVLMLALFSALMAVASDGGMSLFALLFGMFLTGSLFPLFPAFATTLFFVIVWLVPVVALFVQSGSTTPDRHKWSWAWLTHSTEQTEQDVVRTDVAVVPNKRIDLRKVLLPGILVALVYTVLLFAIRLIIRTTVSDAIRDSDQFKIALFQTSLSIGALLQVLVTGFVAARQTHLGGELGIFSAFVSTNLMLAGQVVINVLFGGSVSLAFIGSAYPLIVNVGCLFALIGALIVTASKALRIPNNG